MDFQRLILFVIFSMSGVFLFQAWQKENAPPAPPKPVAAIATPADKKGDVPPGTVPPSAGSVPTAPNNGEPTAPAATAATGGELLTVKTDLADFRINTLGGAIEDVALKLHGDTLDKTKPYHVLVKDQTRMHVAQSGLLGAGMPNHYTLYTKVSSNLDMGSADTLEVRLSTPIASGGKDDLVYTFKRGSYVVDVTQEITNGGSATIAPTAYFQLQRDSVTTGVSNPMGAGAFHGPVLYTEAKKYQKVDFKDVEKGKPGITAERLTDGWIGMVEHYFVDAWLPKAGMPRDYYMSKATGDAYLAGFKTPVGEIAPGATAKVTIPLYMGPQEQDLLKAAAPGLAAGRLPLHWRLWPWPNVLSAGWMILKR